MQKNIKKSAWTLVELVLAMMVIILISGFLISVVKPNTQKAKIYVYATMKNLTKGNIAVIEKYENTETETPKDLTYQDPNSDNDTYCLEMADVFSLSGSPNCSKNASISDVNLTFPNGVTVQGLASPWKRPYATSPFYFKNIIIDIDGEKGLNKIWVDRFPLRIYQGAKYDGTLQPINCADDSIYDDDNKKIVLTDDLGKSPYCKQKFNASGASVAKNFLLDDNVITYDIYSAPTTGIQTKATFVASAQSPAMADCMAYGGNGYLNKTECAALGLKIHSRCAARITCEGCASVSPSICPLGADNSTQTSEDGCMELATANQFEDNDIRCFTLQHKPNGGMSFFVEGLIGSEIDE